MKTNGDPEMYENRAANMKDEVRAYPMKVRVLSHSPNRFRIWVKTSGWRYSGFSVSGSWNHASGEAVSRRNLAVALAYLVMAYVAGHRAFAEYLFVPYVPGSGELTVFCAAIGGAGLAFLWYNAYPAQVFMGDVGALALGGALGTVAVIVRQEIVLAIMGGVFVAETLSVALQVLYFKYSGGKRIFRMAPLHHHYELGGWKETQVVVRFWIITIMLVLVGLSTLKIR